MSPEKSLQVAKDFFAAMGAGDRPALMNLVEDEIEWIIPGDGWALAGTHRGRKGLEALLDKASESVETSYPKPPEFFAIGDRVFVIGVAVGKIKATAKKFSDDWIFAMTVRGGKVAKIREYIDTQALARASNVT